METAESFGKQHNIIIHNGYLDIHCDIILLEIHTTVTREEDPMTYGFFIIIALI